MGISDLCIGAPRYCYSTQDYNEACEKRPKPEPSKEEIDAKKAEDDAYSQTLSTYYTKISDMPLNLQPIKVVLQKYKHKRSSMTSTTLDHITNPCKPTKIKNRWYICENRWNLFLEFGLDKRYCCTDPRVGRTTM